MRSGRSWAIRGGLTTVAAVLGWTSVSVTLAAGMRSRDPQQAHQLAPWDGRATAQLALKRVIDNQAAGKPLPDPTLALEALRQDATAVAAVTALGLRTEQAGDVRLARQWFTYGQRLTRRDLLTQLWVIEDAVRRGDVADALRHYDIALRTSGQASDILFPILAQAIGDGRIRAELGKTLVSRPPWAPLFLEYAAGRSPDPRAASLLLRDVSRIGLPVSGIARELLISRLVANDQYGEAWAYYVTFRKGAARTAARTLASAGDLRNPTVFDWQSVAAGGLSASVENGLIDITVPPSNFGALVRQVQLLPAGSYRLSGHSDGVSGSAATAPYWLLTCVDGRELGRVELGGVAASGGRFAGTITVPRDCAAQTLSLEARRSDAVPGLSAQIDRVQLEPMR